MSDLTERRGGLARLRLALAELEPAELAEALADVDALALARVSHARVQVGSAGCDFFHLPDEVARPRLCDPAAPDGQSVCTTCCDEHACTTSVPL